jgi:flagellar hook-basal body complex protein FliE
MNSQALAAVKAYAAMANGQETVAKAPPAAEGNGFAALLDGAVQSAETNGKALDAGIAAQAAGKADLVDVVTAVAEAELTVQTIVAVRDRVISAYQEIMRMPI